MAENFGWTIEYIEGLSVDKLHEWEQVRSGRAAGTNERQRRDAFLHSKKKGGR